MSAGGEEEENDKEEEDGEGSESDGGNASDAVPAPVLPTKAIPTKAVPTKAAPTKALPSKSAAAVMASESGSVADTASQAGESTNGGGTMTGTWDEKKFVHIASSKYSKNRVVGSTEDCVFVFGSEKTNEI